MNLVRVIINPHLTMQTKKEMLLSLLYKKQVTLLKQHNYALLLTKC